MSAGKTRWDVIASLRPSSRVVTAAAIFGLAAVLVASSAFSIWSELTTQARAHGAVQLMRISDAYHQVRYWVTQEETLERKYRLEPGPPRRRYHNEAAASLMQSLLALRATSTAPDQATIDAVIGANNRYLAAMHEMFDAVDRHDERRVEAIHAAIDPTYDHVEHLTNALEARYHADAYRAIGALDHTQQVLSVLTPIIDLIGLGLLAAGGFVMHMYGRRLDERRRADIVRLEREALTDNLTDLRNHRAYHEELRRAFARSLESSSPLSVALIDVDYFKSMNDSRGHAYGDAILIMIGKHLREIRARDHAYRIGGDEFAVIFTETTADGARAALLRLQHTLAEDDAATMVTLSIGVAERIARFASTEDLHAAADAMLYRAKGEGRNRIIAYRDDPQPATARSNPSPTSLSPA